MMLTSIAITFVAIIVFLLPDLVTLRLLLAAQRDFGHCSVTRKSIFIKSRLDIILVVKVPEDEPFVATWLRSFKDIFPQSCSCLIVASNGSWSEQIVANCPNVTLIHRPENGSKASNIEAGLSASNGDLIAVFDVDSLPLNAIDLAHIVLELMSVDCVQGANLVTSNDNNLVSFYCEYESLLSACISETFASREIKTSQFRGTNGYFRSDTVNRLGFKSNTALEDIEFTLRLLMGGSAISFDPKLLALEAAPASAFQLFKQRRRWYLGWGHLCRLHLLNIFKSVGLDKIQKVRIAGYLVWVTFLLPISIFSVLFSDWPFFGVIAIVIVKFFVLELLVTSHRDSPRMEDIFRAATRANNASLPRRLILAAAIVGMECLKSLSLIGFLFGTSANWSTMRKLREQSNAR